MFLKSWSSSSCMKAPSALPGIQQTVPAGGAGGHGFGTHDVTDVGTPPAAAQSAGVLVTHGTSVALSCCGPQQAKAPDAESSPPGNLQRRSSSLVFPSRTITSLPRGSKPRSSLRPRTLAAAPFPDAVRNMALPAPCALVVKPPTLIPPTTTSNGWCGARPWARTVNVPFDVARSASIARPLARGALAVAVSGIFTTLAPCAAAVESTTAATHATSAAAKFLVL